HHHRSGDVVGAVEGQLELDTRRGLRPDGPGRLEQRPHGLGWRVQHHRAARKRGARSMRITATIAALALGLAAPALPQQQPGPEVAVDIAAIPGVVSGDAQWRTFWEGPMIVDGMTAADDGGVLFAQE